MAEDDRSGGNQGERPDSNGPNARPRNDTIGQSGPGLPDDSSMPVEVDPEEARRIEERIRSIGNKRGT